MLTRRCLACGAAFPLRAQCPHQSYCSAPACQRDRRKHWQRERRQRDDDYRDNQDRAHARWLERHPDYWREYRQTHTDYTAQNRHLQRKRNQRRGPPLIANMDASTGPQRLPSGLYRLTPVDAHGVANMDAWIVQITVLSGT